MDTESQLRSIFQEFADSDSRLKFDGLQELCQRLELQHCSESLSDDLHLSLGDLKGVTYSQFREALIKLLGPETQTSGGRSPSREVSPKYVFGKKKYGRRSRPDMTEEERHLIDDVESCLVTDESLIKKRRTHSDAVASMDDVETNEEDMLVAAWTAVAPRDATLSKDNLVEVFKGLGVDSGSEEAAATVFEKLEITEGITLNTLLTFIKSGATLSRDCKHQDYDTAVVTSDAIDCSSGKMSDVSVLEMWETAGISDGRLLLERLGVRSGQMCDIADLTNRFHSLLRSVREESKSGIFQAGIVLQKAYICSLRGLVEQMSGENEKLKADVIEANQRSQLLAQEVDDHHSRLEVATARQVRALEQKHADRVRELTEQVKLDQEQLIQQNQSLESRLRLLEIEEASARTSLHRLRGDNQQLQDEHLSLVAQLTNVRAERDALKKNVQELSLIQQKLEELEEMARDRDVLALMERVAGLENENRNLQDKNDELTLKLEDLTFRLHNSSFNKRLSPEPIAITVDAAMNELSMDQLTDGEVIESLDGAMKSGEGPANRSCLQKLELSQATNHPLCTDALKKSLVTRITELGSSLGNDVSNDIIKELEGVWRSSDAKSCDCPALRSTVDTLTMDLEKMREEDIKLKSRCEDLASGMEQLQEEMERTEDYWSSKLGEERALFDAEQKLNDDKFSDLVNKIAEYEELMKAEANVRQKLETIEEKDQLEKQVLEIEEEYTKLLAEKDDEIDRLHRELNSHPTVVDTHAQTDSFNTQMVGEQSSVGPCRRPSSDRRRPCCKVYRLQNELRSLLEAKQNAQKEISVLLAERNMIYNQVISQRRSDGCNATLNSKLLCAERRCRTLMASLRNQQLQTSELLRSTWQQHKREVDELRNALVATEGSLHHQSDQLQQQLIKMAAADTLVKDLFCENAYLLAALRKLERQTGPSH